MENTTGDAGGSPSDGEDRLEKVLRRLSSLDKRIERLCEERHPDRLLTREEAADRLRVSVRTLDTIRAAGDIRAVKVKGSVRFHPDALDAYIRRRAGRAGR